ncbi:MAG: DUF6006 family protein [Pseudanabaena sp.]
MTTVIKHSLVTISCSLALSFVASGLASASMVVGKWWNGEWRCNIDGRSARMRWYVADDSQTTCNGETCSNTSGVRWAGKFSDNGSPWVSLTDPKEGNRGGLYFRHADGNQWYLPKPTGNRTKGWTTWNGQRYSLSCWK